MRPAQKLTSVPISTIDVGDKISVDLPLERGLSITHVGIVHRITFNGASRYLMTQEGAIIAAFIVGKPEPRVHIIQRAPRVESMLDLELTG